MKKQSDMQKIALAFVIILVLSLVSDITQEQVVKNGCLERAEIGGKKEEIVLELEMNGHVKDYTVEIMPAQPTKEEASKYFDVVIAEIDRDFQEFEDKVPMKIENLKETHKLEMEKLEQEHKNKIELQKIDFENELLQLEKEGQNTAATEVVKGIFGMFGSAVDAAVSTPEGKQMLSESLKNSQKNKNEE